MDVEEIVDENVDMFKVFRCKICGQPIGKERFYARVSKDWKKVFFIAHLRCPIRTREEIEADLRKTIELLEECEERNDRPFVLYLRGRKHALQWVLRENSKNWRVET